jgi:integrase
MSDHHTRRRCPSCSAALTPDNLTEGRRRRATHPPSSAQQHIKRVIKRVDSYLHDSSLRAWRNNALSNAERDEIINRNLAKLVQIPAPCYKIGKGLPVGDVKRILGEAPRTRLYALYVLAATLGFRRGELLSLRWSDLALNPGTVASTKTVQRVNGRLLMDDIKTEDSDNTVPLPKITQRVLIEHRDQQATDRTLAGELWTKHHLVFSTNVGTRWNHAA